MKRRLIAITAFLAVMLAGCGQIEEPSYSANNDKDNQVAAQIEVQTKVITETSTTTTVTTSAEKNTTTNAESENTIASIETTAKANESTLVNIAKTEDDAESQVSAYETENQDTPQEVSMQETKITQNDDTRTYTNPPTTSSEITTEAPVQANMEISEIFQKLNSLHYEPMTCDGIPEKTFIAEDSTVFAVNFSERWVWRNGVEEAKLTDELYDALVDSEPICLY